MKKQTRNVRRALGFEGLERREVPALIGGEVPVNVKVLNDQFDAAAASSASGRSVVVWTDVKYSGDTDIRARLYDPNGVPTGGDVIVNNQGFPDSQPAVAMNAAGEFVVTWTRTQFNGDRNVQAARFSAAGVNLDGFNFSFTVAGSQLPESDPSIAMNRTGDFVVSYTLDDSPSDTDVLARVYRGSGQLLQVIPVSTSPLVRESRSSVARTPDGRFAVAYQTDVSGVNFNVFLRIYSAAGVPTSLPLAVGISPDAEQLPSVSMDDAGNGVVAYQRETSTGSWDIRARPFNFLGAVSGEINVRSTSAIETAPSVAVRRGGGAFVVAYNAGNTVQVTEVSALDAPVLVGQFARRVRPAVSIDARNVYQVAYETTLPDTDGSGTGIRRRRGLL
ncbi:MAG: hypothetical protein U0835_05080 [Isosphaeraceae bacterium]